MSFGKRETVGSFKDIEPVHWKTQHYVDYLVENGIDEYYYNLFNCMNSDGVSEGFRCPSVDVSRAWAEEKKFFYHYCRDRSHPKHCTLNNFLPTATWECPEGKPPVQIPHRYDIRAKQSHIPYFFDLKDKDIGIKQIRHLAKEARIWHFELTRFNNEFRNIPITPKGMKIKGKEVTTEEKWERTISHNLILEIDTRRQTNNTNKRWDFFGDKSDKIILNAQKLINKVNEYFYKEETYMYEWFFSGNGLYFVLHNNIVSVNNVNKKEEIAPYYKLVMKKWEKINKKIQLMLNKNKINYLELDIKQQFVRSYIKAPFSLHRTKDRIVLPLTVLFGDNDEINLLDYDVWVNKTDPRNIDKKIVQTVSKEIML